MTVLPLDAARALFSPAPGYLSACTMGVPPRPVVDAVAADLAAWSTGRASGADYGMSVERARAAFARLVGVPASHVATGSQTSVMVSLAAAALTDGAEVLCVDGDFTSVVAPFLQQGHRGVRVRHVPLEALAGAIGETTALVAFSLVQSATGAIADADAVIEASHRHGALTLCDLTQAAGWLPVDASRFDLTVTHAYKWLCAPRGAAFLTVSDRAAAWLRPLQAGWYAGEDVWSSCYGPDIELAHDARRFDVSPAWQAWTGAASALEFFAQLEIAAVQEHDAALGDALCAQLGQPARGQAIVTWCDPDGASLRALDAARIVASGRAGNARVAFHLWNDEADVDAVLRALHPLRLAHAA